MSQSKIKAIVPGKPWTAKTGEQMFSYKVTLEDGVFGDANSRVRDSLERQPQFTAKP